MANIGVKVRNMTDWDNRRVQLLDLFGKFLKQADLTTQAIGEQPPAIPFATVTRVDDTHLEVACAGAKVRFTFTFRPGNKPTRLSGIIKQLRYDDISDSWESMTTTTIFNGQGDIGEKYDGTGDTIYLTQLGGALFIILRGLEEALSVAP